MSFELQTILISALPVIELRGALPIAITVYHLPVWQAMLWSIVGNVVIVPPLYWFLKFVAVWARRHSILFDRFFVWYIERARMKFHGQYERWGILALILFVAVPLPGTGAWTGTVAGWVVGMRLRPLFFSVMIGVCLASVIVAGLTVGIEGLVR